jgi:hypothetical protein
VERLVERVEEVAGDHEDVDAPAMAHVAGGAGLGVRVSGADGDAVVEGLEEGGCILLLINVSVPHAHRYPSS